MKTCIVFVLVAFITVGMEMACGDPLIPPVQGKGAEGGSYLTAEKAQSPASDLRMVWHRSRQCAHCRMEILDWSDPRSLTFRSDCPAFPFFLSDQIGSD